MKNYTCCFSGHRTIPEEHVKFLREELKRTILQLADKNITTFVCGGALGFDLLAAEAVLELKKQGKCIFLIMALPCKQQTRFWKVCEVHRYQDILDQADEISYISEYYNKSCMIRRNRKMIDCSAYCITYLSTDHGGTYSTVRYAEKSGLEIINLYQEKAISF